MVGGDESDLLQLSTSNLDETEAEKIAKNTGVKRTKVNLQKLGELRETRLLRSAGLIFMLPNLILGITALF